VLLAALLCVGCATTQQARFQRQTIALSPFCTLTLIRDLRTDNCWVVYTCGWRASAPGIALAPASVCAP
jgi:hypothetical protein